MENFCLILVTLSCILRGALGCVCRNPGGDLKDRFCQHDIVFKGRVLSSVTVPTTNLTHDDVTMYRVGVEKMFRGYLGSEVWLSSRKYSAACGVQLREGIPYLLTTSWDKSLHSCDWNVPMASLSIDEMYVIQRNVDCDASELRGPRNYAT